MIHSQARALAAAVRLLTVVPVSGGVASDAELGRSALFYPLVGFALGGALAGLAAALGNAPAPLVAFIVLGAWVLATGALHLDGLSDSADGVLGGRGAPERIRRIMKDPHVGVAGVAAVVLVLLGKYAALQSLLDAGHAGMIWMVPMLGRAAIVALMLALPYASAGGLGEVIHAHLPRRAALGVVVAVSLVGMWWAAGAVLAIAAVLVAWGRWLRRCLGGATGDAYGAAVEGSELIALLALVAWHG